jgi:head-tail adaptor
MTFSPGIGALQSAISVIMTSTATVLRLTQVPDVSGGVTNTYASVGDVPCWFGKYPTRPTERESTLQAQSLSDWVFVFPLDTDIRNTDRLQVGTRTFEVVNAGTGSIDVARRAICMEIV